MKTISRNRLKAMMDSNEPFELFETLDQDEFDDFHLPGARHMPLDDSFDDAVRSAVPNADTTIVVYCKSENCSASEKAAKRLIDLGYTDVLDYEAGKEDWKGAGLPIVQPTGAAR